MIRFKHLLITRFNLSNRWNLDKQGNIVLDTVWLEDRFHLFMNFCLPSVIGQTSKNYEWWIYFDVNTESKFKELIENIQKQYPNFKPKYEKCYDDFENNMPIDITNFLKSENIDWLITTRLDNDDMLAKDTIEIIQKKINFKNNNLLEIPCGYTLELGNKSKLRKVKNMLNPFISLVEKVKKDSIVKSVYFYQHNEWKNIESIIITNKAQWVQIIHEKNVCNRANGELVYPLNFNSRFKFNTKLLKLGIPPIKLLVLKLNKLLRNPVNHFVSKIKAKLKSLIK